MFWDSKFLSQPFVRVGRARAKADVRTAAVKAQRETLRWIVVLMVVQVFSAVFFLFALWSEVLGLRHGPLPWVIQESAQVLASVGLIAGLTASAIYIFRTRDRLRRLGQQVEAASGAFETQLVDLFAEWQLTQAEIAITVYAMKGFSNAEIGELRNTSEGTVKVQMNAVYRKSGTANRQQLISYLVQEVLDGVVPATG